MNKVRIIPIMLVIALAVCYISCNRASRWSKTLQPKFGTERLGEKLNSKTSLNIAILNAMEIAEAEARQYASGQLDKWISAKIEKADRYLDRGVVLDGDEKQKELMKNLERIVVNSEETQHIINVIADCTMKIFFSSFYLELGKVQEEYKVTESVWKRYLSMIDLHNADVDAAKITASAVNLFRIKLDYILHSSSAKKKDVRAEIKRYYQYLKHELLSSASGSIMHRIFKWKNSIRYRDLAEDKRGSKDAFI